MISLDTNVLVRLIARDDPKQAQKVIAFLFDLESKNKQAFVSSLVILETMWVLSTSLKKTRQEVIQIILRVLKTPTLVIENGEELKELLDFAVHNTLDLSDLMISYRCRVENALPVMTFDKKASRNEMFKLLQ